MHWNHLNRWCCLLALATSAVAQWTKPNTKLPVFSDTYTVGEHIILSWLGLNDSSNDLWLTRHDTTTDKFALRLGTSIDISQSGSFDWTIAIDAEEVLLDTRFILQFLPKGAAYDASTEPTLSSPDFNLILVNQVSPPNGTVGAIPLNATATVVSSTTTQITAPTNTSSILPTLSSSESDSGLSGQVKIGIGIGVAGAVLVTGLLFGVLIGKRHRARRKTQSVLVEVKGPYETLGDKSLAKELSSTETALHELNYDRDNSVSEAGGSMIHEMATIVKKPGLHELPG